MLKKILRSFCTIKDRQIKISANLNKMLEEYGEDENIKEMDQFFSQLDYKYRKLENLDMFQLYKQVEDKQIFVNFQPQFNSFIESEDEEQNYLDFQFCIVKQDNTCFVARCLFHDDDINIEQFIYHNNYYEFEQNMTHLQNIYAGREAKKINSVLHTRIVKYFQSHGLNKNIILLVGNIGYYQQGVQFVDWIKKYNKFLNK